MLMLIHTGASQVELKLRKGNRVFAVFKWNKESLPELLEELLGRGIATEDEVTNMIREAGLTTEFGTIH